MAQVDTSIYGNLLRPTPGLQDNLNSLDAADLQRTQLAGAKVNLIGQQQSLSDQQAIRSLYQDPNFNPSSPEGQAKMRAASPQTWLANQKAMLDNQKIQADTTRAQGLAPDQVATTAKTATETQGLKTEQINARTNRHLQQLVTVSDVPGAIGWINDAVSSGELPIQQAQGVIAGLQSGQIPLTDWKQKAMAGGLTLQQQREAAQKDAAQVEAARHNKADESNTVRGQNMTQQNVKLGISKDYKVAGLDANGNMVPFDASPVAPVTPTSQSTLQPGMAGPPAPAGTPAFNGPQGAPATAPPKSKSPYQGMVDAIGTYQNGEGAVLSRVPPLQKSAVLAQVKEQYPDYNEANFSGIHKTVGAMANGPLGNMTRSINVVQTHLDALNGLIDKMSNGDIQVVNKARNFFQTQTGQTAPTNLAAAKQLIMGEVANVVAAGASTMGDRQTAEDAINKAGSPAQLKGVINDVIRPLMAGKLQGLEQQYIAGTSGRKDYRTKYLSPAAAASLEAVAPSGNGAAGGLPADIQAIIDRHGKK